MSEADWVAVVVSAVVCGVCAWLHGYFVGKDTNARKRST